MNELPVTIYTPESSLASPGKMVRKEFENMLHKLQQLMPRLSWRREELPPDKELL